MQTSAPRRSMAFRLVPLGTSVLLAALLAACGDKQQPAAGGAGGGAPPPPEVAVVTVQPGTVSLSTELPGRLEPSRVARVRARATGILNKRVFTEGTDVRAGQVLYQIDSAPYQATAQSAQAQLAQAQAQLAQADATLRASSRSVRRRSVTSVASTCRAGRPLKLMLPAVISTSMYEPSFLTWRLITGLLRWLMGMASMDARMASRRSAGHRSVICMVSSSASV